MIKKMLCILTLMALPLVGMADTDEQPVVNIQNHIRYNTVELCTWWNWVRLNNGAFVYVCNTVPRRYALPDPHDLDKALHDLAQEITDLKARVEVLESKE